jgi:hypothetical protein
LGEWNFSLIQSCLYPFKRQVAQAFLISRGKVERNLNDFLKKCTARALAALAISFAQCRGYDGIIEGQYVRGMTKAC